MDYLTTSLPIWISILFLIAIPIPVFLVAYLAKKGLHTFLTPKQASYHFYGIIGFYFLYFLYVAVGSFNGLFVQNSLPPRIMVLTALPLLILYATIILNLSATNRILKVIGLSDLVAIHLFRLIGGFFVIMGVYQVVPKTFALAAGFGDIFIALSSIAVSTVLVQGQSYAKKLTWIWNTLGLVDILMTSFMAFWFTKKSIETGSLGVNVLTEFPFCFIPAFAPATIIFLHLCIYKKLLAKPIP
ncbi:MAG: hypothetical protein AAF039_16110 [Bacteroidota bacterium]